MLDVKEGALHFVFIGQQVFNERGDTAEIVQKYKDLLSTPVGKRKVLEFVEGGVSLVDLNVAGVSVRVLTQAEFFAAQQNMRTAVPQLIRKN